MKDYLDLIFTFLKIGITAFGGGYAIIPVLERELVRNKGWITMDEALDYFTVSQITPGVIIVNISTYVGYKKKKIPGAVIATLSFILPGIILMTLISVFLSGFADNIIVQHTLSGIRIAVAALLIDTIFKLTKDFYKHAKSMVLFAVAFSLPVFFGTSPVLVICGAGFLGWVFYNPKKNIQEK